MQQFNYTVLHVPGELKPKTCNCGLFEQTAWATTSNASKCEFGEDKKQS